MQQILHYNICFLEEAAGSQTYRPTFYVNERAYELEPLADAILVLNNCGANWFCKGIVHEMEFQANRYTYADKSPKHLCLYIRNYSDQVRIQVEQGAELSSLLSNQKILYDLVTVPVDFCYQPQVKKTTQLATNDPVFEFEKPTVAYVNIDVENSLL